MSLSADRLEILNLASNLILSGTTDDVLSVWEVTSRFALARDKLLGAEQEKSGKFFLDLSWALRETLRDSTNGALRNNALLAVAISISKGLTDNSAEAQAFDILFSPPLARASSYAILRARSGLESES